MIYGSLSIGIIGIGICSVDFDNSKVYGDTSILDGLVINIDYY